MAISLPFADLPVNLRSIQPYLEIATDYESQDPCISYWCRLYALKQGFILMERVEEDLSFLLVLMEVLGKNKQDLQSKIEITDIPVARAHLEGATQKLLSWAENVPPLESLTKSETLTCVVAKVFQSAGMLQDVRSMFGEPSEGEFEKKKLRRYRYTELHGKNSHNEFHSGSTSKKSNKISENLVDRTSRELQNDEKKNTESTPTDDQNQAQAQKVAKQDDRKKIYGRLFLLQLLNHPVSQKKPEGLPSLEIVRNKMGRNQIIADKLLGLHQQEYQQSPNVNPKTIDLIYRVVRKDREEQKRELNNSQFQEPFSLVDRRSRSNSSDYRWNSVHNSDGRGGNVKLDIKQLRILKAPARDADQAVTSLDTGGKGLISWGQVTSSGVAQSSIGGVGGEKQHSGTYEVISKVDSTPRGSDSFGNSISSTTPASQVNIEFQHSLEKYLRDATHLTTDEICSWIQKQYVGEVNSAFVRALVTAVTENAIEGRGTDSKLNNTVLKNRTEVLRRYVDNIAERELQLLFAVQALVTQRQHPKGLMQGISETLYDSNVVSEEGFESWVSVDDPLEREGKAVTLQMVKSFLTWLKEADPESDEDEDA